MSRIGSKILNLESTQMRRDGKKILISGSLGSNEVLIPDFMTVDFNQEANTMALRIEDQDENFQRKMWGTVNALLRNAIAGVQTKFSRSIQFIGIGYNYEYAADNRTLKLFVGYSNPISIEVPDYIEVLVSKDKAKDKKVVDKTPTLIISSINKQLLHDFAAKIIKQRPMFAFHNMGIKFKETVAIKKEIKKKDKN